MRDRERLIKRIRQIRRTADAGEDRTADAGEDRTADAGEDRGESRTATPGQEQDVIRALEDRVTQLENMVQGLQDSVHREATRQGRRISDLEARIDPAELSRALSQDARERGLSP